MSEKATIIAIAILGISIIILSGIVQDLDKTVDTNSRSINSIEHGMDRNLSTNNNLFSGTVLKIPKEIYYDDWVYIQHVNSARYEPNDVMLIHEDNYTETVIIQFPHIIDDGYLYYSYEANVSDDWWDPMYKKRNSITFEKTLVDNFNETTSDDQEWR